ncbi:lamin tail domain-containing protein [Nocardioides sp. NPDC051685]|uniref:lamin tail domain-containing protein n=1 Tax=Nocardioides sp. NPDC051685 TaxID=3364334 RepID=UPI0037A31076
MKLPQIAAAALTLLAPLALVTTTTAPAQAAGRVYISKVQYDSPGSDSYSNWSLNAEWVRITNTTSRTKDLTGWRLRDRSGHVYVFPTTRLAGGTSITVHTGRGTKDSRNRYWGRSAYVWNNTGDKATLKNRSLAIVDTCAWGDGSGTITC